ncbi:5,6-dimethylbenzimidazole synthase [Methylocystis heyeri]|uniref:5,6-dimethylbenzimidazole synthase n=1 Tax=Methylocystis heyeri TaxID=391905 RepID=A0A6B8KDU9_9HYPH|nr:5,6-dimethylbenzimidazole synthase [Methylocystis heyeri]QGM44600.1 5,6-dimethylbenzimidazole synthase [Methylocystis heyeri]
MSAEKPVENGDLAAAGPFSQDEREAVYRAIYSRRDVRNEFLGDEVPREVLMRILDAAHHAPSVGFMQPWNFIIIKDRAVRQRVSEAFSRSVKEEEEAAIEPARRGLYRNLKLEGILKSPLNICVTCDRARMGRTGLGRSQQPETDLLSTACAVQNLWLAARVEGVGVGWVSILKPDELRSILGVPEHIAIVAYLCVGYVDRAYVRPELEVRNWARRLPLDELVFDDRWGERAHRGSD